jgi:hypothetical protein
MAWTRLGRCDACMGNPGGVPSRDMTSMPLECEKPALFGGYESGSSQVHCRSTYVHDPVAGGSFVCGDGGWSMCAVM